MRRSPAGRSNATHAAAGQSRAKVLLKLFFAQPASVRIEASIEMLEALLREVRMCLPEIVPAKYACVRPCTQPVAPVSGICHVVDGSILSFGPRCCRWRPRARLLRISVFAHEDFVGGRAIPPIPREDWQRFDRYAGFAAADALEPCRTFLALRLVICFFRPRLVPPILACIWLKQHLRRTTRGRR